MLNVSNFCNIKQYLYNFGTVQTPNGIWFITFYSSLSLLTICLSLPTGFLSFQIRFPAPPSTSNIFILLGQSNMAGRGGVTKHHKWDSIVLASISPSTISHTAGSLFFLLRWLWRCFLGWLLWVVFDGFVFLDGCSGLSLVN